jgi:8-oxo-dGTP pyrophosphatase MutT (NUDIX family)
MAGTFVFPGGLLEEVDRRANFWLAHCDLEPAAVAERLGDKPGSAAVIAYGVAAIRETYEEAGVLLASGEQRTPQTLDKLAALRSSGRMPPDWLASEAAANRLALSFSALRPWAHWVTPEAMQKRFETRFFTARMPSEQQCRPDNIETVQGIWSTPEQALAGNLEGRIPLSPPALMTLHEMMSYADLTSFWNAARERVWDPVRMPRLVRDQKVALILFPGDPDYDRPQVTIGRPQQNRLPVGEPFTRVWLADGIWHPVGR